MGKFLGKFENSGINIARINSICVAKSINLLWFWAVSLVRCDVNIFKLIARALSRANREACGIVT